jgi:hypothetical protein
VEFSLQPGKSEIGDARTATAVDHHVGRLQIAMQDALLVGGRQTGADAARDLDCFVLRQTPDSPEQRGQVLSVDVLHGKVGVAVQLADVVDPANVGMGDLERDADLVQEALVAVRVPRQRPGQELQRHGLAQFEVVRAVDLAHPAAPEQADDAVAVCQHRAGEELALLERDRSRRE